ncbi:uncharacterized protein F5891DRAFT_897507, partial [Suillus fuscotomentosus]
LATCSPEELEDTEVSIEGGDEASRAVTDLALPPSEVAARRQAIKNKILAVGKMQRVFQLLRSAENTSELAAVAGEESIAGLGHVRSDLLTAQGTQMRHHIRNFADARRSDLLNERLPIF